MAKVTMPQLGESVAEGTIGRWLKQPGDTVEKYEPLLEVITDKVNAEVPSPYAGVLKEILVEEGATVPNNAEIAVIETADDEAGGTAAVAPVATEAQPEASPEGTIEVEPANLDAAAANGPAGSDERPAAGPANTAPAATAAAPSSASPAADGDPNARMTPAVAAAAPRAWPRGLPDRGHRRWWPDHPRGRPRLRGGGPDGPGPGRAGCRACPGPECRADTGGARSCPCAARRRRDQCRHHVPRGRGRGPRPDDPDAQGHRGADDPRPQCPARLRPDGDRRDEARPAPRERQEGVPGEGGHRALVRPVRREGVRRGAEEEPDLQRALDRAGPAGEAAA